MLDVNQLIEEIRSAGADNLGHFGNGYKFEGGYALQQNPEEFSAAVSCLHDILPADSTYFEIGTASGGTLRFLAEHLSFGSICAMDDRGHARASEQDANFSALQVAPCLFIGDSHSLEAKQWVQSVVGFAELVFIDGDHSYNGCKQDLEMVLPYARYVMFHDTVACDGVKRVWDEAIATGKIRAVLHVAGKERPLGIGIGEVIR